KPDYVSSQAFLFYSCWVMSYGLWGVVVRRCGGEQLSQSTTLTKQLERGKRKRERSKFSK
ncbi:hypothetical protein, partial [Myroides odoratus]|uniref:hypothetical protein n=1 Tax=Myroides odoratus TaxID=256 RepID=UPI00333E2B14